MRITFVIPNVGVFGGIRVVATHARYLQDLGHDVLVIAVKQPRPTLRERARALLKEGKILRRQPERDDNYVQTAGVPLKIVDHPKPIVDDDVPDADVVVATWWETAEWVAQLSPAKGEKFYFIQHHEIFDACHADRVRATYHTSLHKITISQWLVDTLRQTYDVDQVALVPNSVDPNLFQAPPRRKNSVLTVGFLYFEAPWKGCDITLKALDLVAKRVPDLRVISFGTRQPLPELPLPPNAHYSYQPPQHTIKDIYASCDVWLFSSRSEGFGLPILEAMACRTPVIGTPAGAAPELLGGGGGLLVPPESPEDMAQAIEQVAQMSKLEWQAMSDRAYATATQYSWNDAAHLLERAFYSQVKTPVAMGASPRFGG
jgi:glycosyltransferase involved in cell wall biosynthesis